MKTAWFLTASLLILPIVSLSGLAQAKPAKPAPTAAAPAPAKPAPAAVAPANPAKPAPAATSPAQAKPAQAPSEGSGQPTTCTATPSSPLSSEPPATSKDKAESGGQASQTAASQVNVYTTAPPAAPKKATQDKPEKPVESFTYSLALPQGTTNAATIASYLKSGNAKNLTGILDVSLVPPNTLSFVLDSSKVVSPSQKPTSAQISTTTIAEEVNALAEKNQEFAISLPPGTGKACDVAHAIVNSIPGVLSITAVSDSQLVFTTIDPTSERVAKKAVEEAAAPLTPPSPHVASYVQRLFYIHDAAAVAAIVNNALPNVAAQALAPDLIVLSDSAEANIDEQSDAIRKARQMVSRIDQPHPQVSVDAWSLQLAADNAGEMQRALPRLEEAAADYDTAVERSRQAGWRYLSRILVNPDDLDPLLRQYLSYSTRILGRYHPNVYAVEDPSTSAPESDLEKSGKISLSSKVAKGYGLGYSTLYYPLTPNLIDMLVTFISLKNPSSYGCGLFNAMEGLKDDDETPCAPPSNDQTTEDKKRKNKDAASKEQEVKEFQKREIECKDCLETLSCQERDTERYDEYTREKHDNPPYFQLECLRDAVIHGLLYKNKLGVSTSSLGQTRAALADFLFHYKLLVEYPDDSFPYLEPAAADTLDSAFNPLVIAFERDVATFQHTLQNRCANILNSKKTGIKGYGYSGLVNVKVLGGQEGAVKTTAQNYFNATPVPSINQLFSSLAAQAASEAKSPLPSLVTDIAPAKAVEVLAALGPVLNPPAVTAHIGRELDLTVTAHTLAGAYGAELDVQVDSAENGSGNFTAGSSTKSDDLNSRVATHSVDTHVRLESMRLLELSTMGSVLARSQQPWKPVDPYFEIPGLDLIVKKPRPAKEVFTQSLVFLDATVVPTAADLGDGVPLEEDKIAKRNESSAQESATGHNEEFDPGCFVDKHKCHWIRLHDLYFTTMGGALLQFHNKIVNCLNSEYIGSDGTVQVALPTTDFVGSKDPAISGPCNFTDPHSLGYINPDPTSAVTVPDPSLTSPNALPQ